MGTRPAVDLVVNCYERTYPDVLAPGFFGEIEAVNRFRFASRYVVINNVDEPARAIELAEKLQAAGEIQGFVRVTDRLADALRVAGLPRRALGRRPYFLDYALVMVITGTSPWLLGWDAEVTLDQPLDWITPAVELMSQRRDIFSASPRWPSRGYDTLAEETIETDGPWHLNWGFSDQVFLVRREAVARPIYRRFAPASMVRNSGYPFTFEARVESYQRAARCYRASHAGVQYQHNDMAPVMQRLGASRSEQVREKVVRLAGKVLRRVGSDHPRLRLP